MNQVFEINITLPTNSNDTLTDSISRQLKENIEQGNLPANTKLPSSRQFAQQFNISRNTVLHIYDNLINEGYLYTKRGDGSYVKAPRATQKIKPAPDDLQNKLVSSWCHVDMSSILLKQPNKKFNFNVGETDINHFPFDLMRKYMVQSTRSYSKRSVLDISPKGDDALRQVLVNHLAISRTVLCSEDNLIVTNGFQQSLDLIAKILIKPNQTKVVIEQPCYAMAEILFQAHGAIVVPVAVDKEGIIVDDIPHDADLIYVTPSHQFPLGMAMSPKRRHSLMALADQNNMLIIEDDYDSEFRLTREPVNTLYTHAKKDNVFLIGTFSKSLMPDVRTGFIAAPVWASEALQSTKFVTDRRQPAIRQRALHAFIEQGHLLKHLKKMRRIYQERYQALLLACEKHSNGVITPIPIKAGIHVTANLPNSINAKELADELTQHQVSICSIQHVVNQPITHNGLIFGLGRIEAQNIEAGIQKIMQAI